MICISVLIDKNAYVTNLDTIRSCLVTFKVYVRMCHFQCWFVYFDEFWWININWKKNYHTVRTISVSNRKQRQINVYKNLHSPDFVHALRWSGGSNLVLRAEMCFQDVIKMSNLLYNWVSSVIVTNIES